MTFLDDLRNDYLHQPGVVTVTHTTAAGVATATVKAHVDLSGPTYKELQPGTLGIEPTDSVWHVWAATLATAPVQGDTITESGGTVWTILSVTDIAEGEPGRRLIIRWRCVCRKQV